MIAHEALTQRAVGMTIYVSLLGVAMLLLGTVGASFIEEMDDVSARRSKYHPRRIIYEVFEHA